MKSNDILNKFIKYVSLNVLGMIGLSCYILADTFFVSKGMGADGLTALNLAISIYSFIHGTGLMVGIGGATRFGILRSQGEEKKADRIFSQSVFIGLFLGTAYVFIGVFASGVLSRILGADQVTFQMTSVYLKTILCFSPAFILNNVMIAFVRNDGNPKLSMAAMLTGSISNIILDYVFIFPLDMGMFGVAFATGLAPAISIFILLLHVFKKKNGFHLCRFKLSVKKSIDIVSLGLSAFINEFASGIVLIIFNLVILGIAGNTGVAAYGIVANLSLVAASVFTGIGQGLQPIVSASYGWKKAGDLKKAKKYGWVLAICTAIFIYILVSVYAGPLVNIFNGEKNPVLARYAATGIYIYFSGFVFSGINVVMSAYLSAVERPKDALMVSITRGGLAIIPLVFIMSEAFGMAGVWLSFPSAEALASLVCIHAVTKSKKLS